MTDGLFCHSVDMITSFWISTHALDQGCQFRSVLSGMTETFHTNSNQFKKQNKTEQILSHFKSRSIPDFSAKFHPECSDFIPHVPFRS